MAAGIPPGTHDVRLKRWHIVAGAILVAIGILILIFDWNWFKGPIERRVAAATGREFRIHGDLDVDLGLRTTLRVSDVQFANATWSKQPQMFELKRIEAHIKVLPLLRGALDLPFIDIDAPRLLIERNEQGMGNWVFKPEDKPDTAEPAKLPLIREIRIRNGQLHVIEPTYRTDLQLLVRSGERSGKDAHAPLLADGKGSYRDSPFSLRARVDSPLDFQHAQRPYRVDMHASAGATHAHVSGSLLGQLQFEEFDVRTDASGENLADLYELLGIALPDTPPYQLSGALNRSGATWSYTGMKGRIGDSDVSGNVSVELPHAGRDRLKLTANLVSKRLDFDDLGGLIGAPPSTKEGETASAEQRAQSSLLEQKPRVLPDAPFKLDKLRAMDADVRLRAEQINSPKLPLEKMDVHLVLDDGVMNLRPLNFNAAGGVIASHIELDAREVSIQSIVTGEVNGLQLPLLFPSVQLTHKGAGELSGAIALTASGNSVAHMLGSANGNIGLIMGEGHISNLLVELAGLDVAEALKYLIDKDREIPLRCAYAAFDVKDGVMAANGLAFDTTDTAIFGQGDVNLRAEAINLRLLPQPKDKSPLTLRVPLKIGGTFKDPSFRPETAPLIARGAAAAALYSVAPPAALLALIETGPGKDIDCRVASNQKPPKRE